MSVLKITNDNFNEEVLNSDKTTIVDFYADWCGPCKMLSPIIDQIADERTDITNHIIADVAGFVTQNNHIEQHGYAINLRQAYQKGTTDRWKWKWRSFRAPFRRWSIRIMTTDMRCCGWILAVEEM